MIPGDRTYHAGPTPIEGKPSTLSQRGLHFTPAPGLAVEVWQWNGGKKQEAGDKKPEKRVGWAFKDGKVAA